MPIREMKSILSFFTLLLLRCRDCAHINTSAHAGLQLQVLKVGVSCLAIPLAGGVRPLGLGLSLHRAECCPEPSHKHLGNFAAQLAVAPTRQLAMKSCYMQAFFLSSL